MFGLLFVTFKLKGEVRILCSRHFIVLVPMFPQQMSGVLGDVLRCKISGCSV